MTKQKYLDICERMGEEPDPKKMPPSFSDLSPNVQEALSIYNRLPDTYTGGQVSTYAGKNLSALEIVFDIHLITDHPSRAEILEIITHLDNKSIKESNERAKAEIEKAKAGR